MTLNLFWVDFWLKDRLFGIGLFTVKQEELHRSLFSIYWNDGETLIDLLWFRIYSDFPLFFGGFIKRKFKNSKNPV